MYTKFVSLIKYGRHVNYLNGIQQRTALIFNNEAINKRTIHLASHIWCKNESEPSKAKKHTRPETSSDSGTNRNGNIEAKPQESRVDCEHSHLQEIIEDNNRNYRVMICMRGAPGSGKSRLARTIIDRTVNEGNYSEHIFSADDYFYDQQTKQYNYDRSRLRQAHKANINNVARRARSGWSPIIIDNTNMKLWEMFAYVKEGIRNGYAIRILEPSTKWAKSVDELAARNTHKVDAETIQRMLSIYEPGSVDGILNALKLRPSRPMLRNFPKIREPNDACRASDEFD